MFTFLSKYSCCNIKRYRYIKRMSRVFSRKTLTPNRSCRSTISVYFCETMKKSLLILVTALYMVVTCGISINFHYCMGKLKSVAVGQAQNDHCEDCGMVSKKSACCHDDTKWLKVDDNHQSAYSSINFQAPTFLLTPPERFILTPPLFSTALVTVNNNSPPIIVSGTSLTILYRNFRI